MICASVCASLSVILSLENTFVHSAFFTKRISAYKVNKKEYHKYHYPSGITNLLTAYWNWDTTWVSWDFLSQVKQWYASSVLILKDFSSLNPFVNYIQ